MELHDISKRTPENLYRRQEAAYALKVTTSVLDQLIATGQISTVNIKGRIRITPAALLQYIKRQPQAAVVPQGTKLKLVRESAGLTPEQLESLCHLEPGTVLAVEQGHTIAQQIFALLIGSAIYAGLVNQPEPMSA
jgi:hypothetical protein